MKQQNQQNGYPSYTSILSYGKNYRVFIIDDDEFFNRLMYHELMNVVSDLKIVSQNSISISSYLDAKTFLNHLHNGQFDQEHLILFLDYHLGNKLKGIEILRHVLMQKPGSMIIMVSESQDKEIYFETINAGASDFLNKNKHTPLLSRIMLEQLLNK